VSGENHQNEMDGMGEENGFWRCLEGLMGLEGLKWVFLGIFKVNVNNSGHAQLVHNMFLRVKRGQKWLLLRFGTKNGS
jgi:hypothetical protein